MEIRNIKRVKKIISFLKFNFHFSGKTNDHIDTNCAMRH